MTRVNHSLPTVSSIGGGRWRLSIPLPSGVTAHVDSDDVEVLERAAVSVADDPDAATPDGLFDRITDVVDAAADGDLPDLFFGVDQGESDSDIEYGVRFRTARLRRRGRGDVHVTDGSLAIEQARQYCTGDDHACDPFCWDDVRCPNCREAAP